MDIGRPKRIIEIEPASLPLPDLVPAVEPGPATVPAPVEPEREPSESP